jgi:hypothetical protein
VIYCQEKTNNKKQQWNGEEIKSPPPDWSGRGQYVDDTI